MATVVKRTARFSVLESSGLNTSSANLQLAPKDSSFAIPLSARDVVVLSLGKRVTVDDVAKVSHLKYQVAVDEQIYEKIDAETTGKRKGVPLAYTAAHQVDLNVPGPMQGTKTGTSFPQAVCRAGMFARLVSLVQGRAGVQSSVIRAIVDLLNADVVPSFSSDESAGAELVAVLSGIGSDALVAHGLATVSLTVEEAKTLVAEKFLYTGAACALTSAAVNIGQTLDCIASLSCESFGAYTAPFEAAHFELNRQHRGQMTSASNLRLLVEGSKRINSPQSKDLAANLAFQKLPQVNGAVLESIHSSAKTLEIELNSGESGPIEGNESTRFEPIPSLLAVQSIVASLSLVAVTTGDRLQVLQGGKLSSSSATNLTASMGGDLLIRGFALVAHLTGHFATELRETVSSLNSLDSAAQAGNDQSGIEPSESERGGGAKKPEVDDSKLTPDQLAKAEAKRKAKAEKAAAKAAAKEAKKGGTSALVLGVGSTKVRAHINAAMPALSVDTLQSILNPYNTNDDSFVQFCKTLLEQLNSGGKRKPKIAKGTRDYLPEQMRIREQAFAAIKRVFKRHGGVEIDTPVFELKEVLMGKYGEDSKLIYDLADQGGELLSLRYDLTVPFARFLAMNSVGNIKRYHIAKVYRRDQPQLNRGRYREFYQCDFDVAGSYIPMIADAEVITVAVEILSDLPVGNFVVKLNHRKLLDAIFEICGVPSEKFRPICSAVDKLDKLPWEEVRKEMVVDKGLAAESADRIGFFVRRSGQPKELWRQFQEERIFGDHIAANAAMEEMRLLFEYLDAMGSLSSISFDMSLARGLDYYTGVIYEVVLTDGTSQVGSIAAGGRYDNLVGMFSTSGTQTPCVGVSIGIERVFTIMERKAEELKLLQSSTIEVYVASIGENLIPERMKVSKVLWNANISSEFSRYENPKFKKQLDEALERAIPFIVVFGADELKKGTVKVKNMTKFTEVEVPVEELVATLIADGCKQVAAGADLQFLAAMKSGPSP